MDSIFNLNVLGINNVAYSKCEALRMISCFEEQGIPVLGGDVFLLTYSGAYPFTFRQLIGHKTRP